MFSSQPEVSPIKALLTSILLSAGSALLIASPATGQDKFVGQNPPDTSDTAKISGQISGGAVLAAPRGGLGDNVGTGGGFRLSFQGWTGQSPLLVGVDLGILGYGRATDQVPFSSTVGPRVPVEVTTSNMVLQTHLSARLQPRAGRFRPYAEALAGFKYFFTRTKVGETDVEIGGGRGDGSGDEVASSTNFDDFALSGGLGAGIDIRVYRQSGSEKTLRRVDLYLGVQYLLGQEAEYLAEGDLTDENGNGQLERSEMDVRRSRTTFLQPQFGVTFRLADTD
ncbi:hypothetical protein [Salinibacter altiplanensis]|uniref:hypothetical protein n=1 Tax=Salinibacter altiplanensis TaxID=1803181 RepID=UPI000C9F707E|nr:hypothetical protein [Salinibacter altiplanensis]